MRVAVLTLCRDRLDYTRHCFQTLRDNAGCDYDHFIVDQASTDGTREWLLEDPSLDVTVLKENAGICRALNLLLDEAVNPALYDVIVRFDNDCEVLTPNTLGHLAYLSATYEAIVAPRVHGLQNPPPTLGQFRLGDDTVDATAILGGVFMVMPATLFANRGFRYNEHNPPWTGDEAIVPWWRAQGGTAGYVQGYDVNHYETSVGQQATFPEYHDRKLREIAA